MTLSMGTTRAVETVATKATSLAAGLGPTGPERWANEPLGWVTRTIGDETTRTRLLGPGATDAELGAYRAIEPADLYSGLYKANEATRDTNAGAQLLLTDGARVIHAPAYEMRVADDGNIARVPLHVDGLRADGDVNVEITHPALQVVVGKHTMFASDATRLGLELDGRMANPGQAIATAPDVPTAPVVAAKPAVEAHNGLVPVDVLKSTIESVRAKAPAEITATPVQRAIRVTSDASTGDLPARFPAASLRDGLLADHGRRHTDVSINTAAPAREALVVRGSQSQAEIAASTIARGSGREVVVLPSFARDEWLVRELDIAITRHDDPRVRVNLPPADRMQELHPLVNSAYREAAGGVLVAPRHIADLGGSTYTELGTADAKLACVEEFDAFARAPRSSNAPSWISHNPAVQRHRELREADTRDTRRIHTYHAELEELEGKTGWGSKRRAEDIAMYRREIESLERRIEERASQYDEIVPALRPHRDAMHALAERDLAISVAAERPDVRMIGRSSFVDAEGAVDARWNLGFLDGVQTGNATPKFDTELDHDRVVAEVRRRAIDAGSDRSIVALDTGDGQTRIYQAANADMGVLVNTPFERAGASVRAVASGDRWADLHPERGAANYDPSHGQG